MEKPSEIKRLIEMVRMFAKSSDNKCWPTVRRWSVSEAKVVLLAQAKEAAIELALEMDMQEDF